jgi:hypothetical protein
LLGGTVQLKGVEGAGTIVTVRIPTARRKEVGYHENTHRG